MNIHYDYPPIKKCVNPDSYGMICVKCNQCGRFSPSRNAKGRFIKIKKTRSKQYI